MEALELLVRLMEAYRSSACIVHRCCWIFSNMCFLSSRSTSTNS